VKKVSHEKEGHGSSKGRRGEGGEEVTSAKGSKKFVRPRLEQKDHLALREKTGTKQSPGPT